MKRNVAIGLVSDVVKSLKYSKGTKQKVEPFPDGTGIICRLANGRYFKDGVFQEVEVESAVVRVLTRQGLGHLYVAVWDEENEDDPRWFGFEISEPTQASDPDPKTADELAGKEVETPDDWVPKKGDKVTVALKSWVGWTGTVTKVQNQSVWIEAVSKTGRGKWDGKVALKNLRKA